MYCLFLPQNLYLVCTNHSFTSLVTLKVVFFEIVLKENTLTVYFLFSL